MVMPPALLRNAEPHLFERRAGARHVEQRRRGAVDLAGDRERVELDLAGTGPLLWLPMFSTCSISKL